jgi:hypothetical protein
LNVKAKENMFLNTRRQVKASMDMPPVHISISTHDTILETYDAHPQCIARWQQHHKPYPSLRARRRNQARTTRTSPHLHWSNRSRRYQRNLV